MTGEVTALTCPACARQGGFVLATANRAGGLLSSSVLLQAGAATGRRSSLGLIVEVHPRQAMVLLGHGVQRRVCAV